MKKVEEVKRLLNSLCVDIELAIKEAGYNYQVAEVSYEYGYFNLNLQFNSMVIEAFIECPDYELFSSTDVSEFNDRPITEESCNELVEYVKNYLKGVTEAVEMDPDYLNKLELEIRREQYAGVEIPEVITPYNIP